MTSKQDNINIKGTKNGLTFLFNDECSFEELMKELKDKLENSHQGILTGPVMQVTIKTGYRKLTDKQVTVIRKVFKSRGNLFIKNFESDIDILEQQREDMVTTHTGIIRSGQVHQFEGNILYIGDINPGGSLKTTGDIYVLGNLRGNAYAGINGNTSAIIAASTMAPLQLHIADVSLTSFKEENKNEYQQIAYIEDGQILFDKLVNFSSIKNKIGILS